MTELDLIRLLFKLAEQRWDDLVEIAEQADVGVRDLEDTFDELNLKITE